MRSSLLYLFETWLACTVFGLAALAPMRRSFRDLWLPAAPALGAAFLVVTLHTTSVFVGVRVGVFVVMVPAVALVILGVRRGTRPWQVGRSAVLASALTSLIGLFGAWLALLPNFLVGSSRILQSASDHDVFYYVSESVWLSDHPLTDVPAIGSGPGAGTASPLATDAAQAIARPLRVGQVLVTNAVQSIFGTDELAAYMPTMACWVLIFAGAVYVSCRLLRLGKGAGYAAAGLLGGSAFLARAAYEQKADSLLGYVFVVLALAAVVGSAFRAHPKWPAVLLTAGLFGTYTEYFFFLGPALAGGAFLTVGRGYLVHVRRSMAILALAVLVSPMIWYRGIKSLLVSDYAGDAFLSPYMTENPILALGRALGTTTTTDTTVPVPTTLGLALLVVGGILLGLVLSRYRVVLLGAVATSVLAIAYATLSGRGYLQNRLVTLALPLFWLATTAGWALLVRHLRRNRSTVGRLVSVTLVVSLFMATSYYVVANGVTAGKSYRPELAKDRNVSGEYGEVLGWVRDLGGPEGQDVTVAVPELFPQLWSLYEFRNEKDVSYLCLRPDFLQPEQYWNGEVDRYLVVGSGVVVAGDQSAVIRSTPRFRLIDMNHGAVAVVVPANITTWSGGVDANGKMSASSGSRLIVLRGRNAPAQLDITMASPLPALMATLTTSGGSASSTSLDADGEKIRITSLRSEPALDLTLTTNDPRDTTRQFRLVGASFPPNP